MMQVTVELYSYFRKGRFARDTIEIPEGTTTKVLLQRLKIPPPDVGVLVINGKAGSFKSVLQPGDSVTIIPSIGGG